MRVVREHFPDIYLTFTREPQHRRSFSLTRIRKFFQIHSVQRSPQLAHVCLKYGRTCVDNSHGALDCNDFHLQPFSRFSSLLDLARIFLPVKHMFSCTKVRRNKLRPFSKILADVFSLLSFKMSFHSQFLDFLVEEVLLGWRGYKLFWIHGRWVQEISWVSSHGQFHGRFATSGHLCISHRCCSAHQLGKSDLCQSGLVQVFWSLYPPECQE